MPPRKRVKEKEKEPQPATVAKRNRTRIQNDPLLAQELEAQAVAEGEVQHRRGRAARARDLPHLPSIVLLAETADALEEEKRQRQLAGIQEPEEEDAEDAGISE